MSISADQLANLSPEQKRTLLARMLQQRAQAPLVYPASLAQQRMWLLWQIDPTSPAYNIFMAIRSCERLDLGAMEQALNLLIQRHAALCTTFKQADGQTVQVVAAAQPLSLTPEQIVLPAPEQREAALRARLEAEIRTPFDLIAGPLFRARLFWLDEREHVLCLNMHHSIADGWSLNILIRELLTLYGALCQGVAPALPELPIQYADYAVWQKNLLSGPLAAEQIAYWKERLAGAPSRLELPTDRPRPAVQTFRGSHQRLLLPPALGAALQALSQREGTTLFMVLLAAFKLLLCRYSGQTDLLVGTPVANRSRVETEGLIGFFVNTLVMRTSLAGDPSFRELLQRVRLTAIGAYDHQDVPFEWLVDALQPERDPSYSPLVQVLFALQSQNTLLVSQGLSSNQFELMPLDNQTAKFDLTVAVEETGAGLLASFEYNTDLFHDATIQRMVGHFQTLLERVVAAPEQRLSQIDLLSPAERRQILQEWNKTASAYPRQPVQTLFDTQARRTPGAVALRYDGGCVTYAELQARANRLAHYLREHGAGPERLVGICLERSPEQIVALLATLKAGAAYLPLDPSYPAQRLGLMLADAEPVLLISNAALAERLPVGLARLVVLEHVQAAIDACPSSDPPSQTTPNHLAYVIYTSGSTGVPKGVMIPHRAIVRLVRESNYVAIQPNDVVAQVANSAFDAATFEIWGALLNGAQLALISRDLLLSPGEVAEQLRRHAVTAIFLTTALFNQLSRTAPGIFAGMRHVLFGGEACDPHLVRAVLGHQPPERLLHVYGPTETTTYTTWYEIDQVPDGAATIPIGRSLSNDQAFILDPALQPVPVGVIGELYIGGAGLARGYLRRPDLTAERFVPNPFAHERPTTNDQRPTTSDEGRRTKDEIGADSSTPLLNSQFSILNSARLYRTGDLVRWLPGGLIEFVGRRDHQVKLRGFRIELGEIEAALSLHPAVRQAVVLVREDTPGVRRLAAYVVPQPGQAPVPAELQTFLRARLPEYMLPGAIMLLEHMPLNPNGKIDRQTLPAPLPSGAVSESEPALGPVEETLAQIWAEVLGLERVGRQDNFFDIGGDSIISLQIIARAQQHGLRLTPKQIFQNPTVATLAQVVEHQSEPAPTQGPLSGPVALTPIQRWFFEQPLPAPQHYNQSVIVEVRGRLDPLLLERALRAVLAQHDSLRLRFVQMPEGWRQHYAEPDERALCTRIDLSGISAADHEPQIAHACAEAQASLDLTHGPLLRAVWFDCAGSGPDRLALIVHHLVIDHASWQILMEDLLTSYQQARAGAPVCLPPKTSAFQAWAERLERYAQSDTVQSERGYWLVPARAQVGCLPLDMPEGLPDNREHSLEHVTLTLDQETTQTLLQQAPRAYNNRIEELLLAALAQTLAAWSASPAVLIDLEGHGRSELFEGELDVSRTVGWFTTIFPALIELPASAEPGLVLRAVKEQLRAVPRRGTGYGVLRYLGTDPDLTADLRALPPAEVAFNYLGQTNYRWAEGALFGPPREAPGPARSPDAPRSHLLLVTAYVLDGRLVVTWSYSRKLHRPATVARLAQTLLDHLQTFLEHCLAPDSGAYTPSDFPLANLDERKLQKIARLIGSKNEQRKRPGG